MGTGSVRLGTAPPPNPRFENDVDELRRRLRACVLELVPSSFGIFRYTLYQVIDKAPPAALRYMRERIWELVA